jgi:MFS transporter, UMF1 family
MNNGKPLAKNDKKEIFGWMLYDWANSAFYTSVVAVLIGPYLVALAEKAVGKEGVIFELSFFKVTPGGLLGVCIAISVLLMVILLPILGAIADYTHLKKSMMAIFCYGGVISSALLFFVKNDSYIWCSVLLIVSNMCFASANVFYNAFLIDICSEDQRDKISSYGYGLGYIGGVAMLVLNLLLINNAENIGIDKALAVRISFLAASLWWGVFGFFSFYLIKSRDAVKDVPDGKNLVAVGFVEIWETLKELRRLKYTMIFLIAYLFYNDGIQTVILMSSTFLSQELFTQAQRDASEVQAFLIQIFLIAQVSAFVGAMVFERIARVIGAKRTIILSLIIWCGIVIFAYGFLQTQFQAMIMGGFIGLVLGAAQALSRSLYSQMIPVGRESSFFGLYEISEKGTSWMGQLMFTIVIGYTGSFRQAILALIFFFVAGSVILLFTNTTKAIHEAGNLTPEEALAVEPA